MTSISTANQWLHQASSRPVPKMLLGKFWYEGELCILFADSNLGKSIREIGKKMVISFQKVDSLIKASTAKA